MKKLAIIVSLILIGLIVAVVAAVGSFSNIGTSENGTLPENTVINGVDCSSMTFDEAEDALTDHWNSRHIEVTCGLNVRTANFTDFGYTYDLDSSLKNLFKTHPIAAALNRYLNIPVDINIPMKVKDYDEDFKTEVINAGFFDIENMTESTDAYVDVSDPQFPIVNHTYGTEPDMDRVFEDLTACISNGELNFVFDERDYFIMPEVTAKDPELLEYQKFCQKHLNQKITYKLGDETFTISSETLATLMKDDLSGEADKAKVAKYVKSLAAEYDNINTTREFTSFTGKEVSVPPGTYGWMIDQEAETKALVADINSHKDVSRKPKFSATGYGKYCRDMGDTYIDVDISEQTVNYYKKGELVFSSPCVTGSAATGTVTDVGAYYILNKVRDVVLKGDNGDGTEYESFVHYWLGVNWAGEGFHDASWRSNFGGSIWTYNGSHGCINMPPRLMPEFYEMVDVDIPVAVHY
ncbi:MAG: L,D-transpeptidase family protein [Bacillota bacterium]|nr:L,D-transpeptidase family protein [Bacillota bacterium]